MPDDASLPIPRPDPVAEVDALLRDLYLSPRDRRWVEAYVLCGSPREAWRQLGQEDIYGSHYPTGWEVKAAIARLQGYYSAKIGLDTERVLAGLKAEAFHDPAEIYKQRGHSWKLKPLDEWPLEIRQCITEVQTHTSKDAAGTTHTRVKVKFADRQRAKELLGKHLRMFEAEKQQTVPYTLIIHQHAAPVEDEPKLVQVIETEAFRIEMPEG